MELGLENIFIGDTEGGIECGLSRFADGTKLGVGLEGRDAVQRDLERLERWAWAKLMRFSTAKCRVWHLGRRNGRHPYGLEGGSLRAALQRRSWGSRGVKS